MELELLKEKTKLEKAELKTKKFEVRQEEKKEKKSKKIHGKISKILSGKLISRKIFKPSQMTITIKKQEPHSILGEENRFFSPILEQEKRSMFFD